MSRNPFGCRLLYLKESEDEKMPSEIIVAALSMLGTAIGSIAGVMAANKLTNYRIEQLEKKVDKHNTVIERTFKLEEAQAVLTEQIKVANHRIDDLERED